MGEMRLALPTGQMVQFVPTVGAPSGLVAIVEGGAPVRMVRVHTVDKVGLDETGTPLVFKTEVWRMG